MEKKTNTPAVKIPVVLLIIALVLVIAGSVLARNFNTGKGATDVNRISFETERGKLSGLLYMPKGASAADPRPAVVVTHGYLNSAEMQDANAIELSRRGYVVLALDMYDHGHSAGNADNTGGFFSFWPYSQYDAVQYMYAQPYVLKDEQGNGIIGVTGHSMGGFSSQMAVWFDEADYLLTGIRKISAILSEGSDYQWCSYLGLTVEEADQSAGGRFYGKVCAQFDEFFFNADNAEGGTVRRKNFVGTTAGKTFLQQENPQSETWYETSDGGHRIVYQPYETHPWNHFSTVTTGNAVDFYNTAFAAWNTKLSPAAGTDQVWLTKELCELVALIGLMLLVVPLIMAILRLPFFGNAVTALKVQNVPAGGSGWLLLILGMAIPGVFFNAMMDKNLASPSMWALTIMGAAFAVIAILGFKRSKLAAGLMLFYCALCIIFTRVGSYSSALWCAPSVNQIAYWTLICTAFAGMFTLGGFLAFKAPQGVTLEHLGLTFKPRVILSALLTALLAVAGIYAVVFAVDALFKTDFRIWVFAFKTFEPGVIRAMLLYLPTFLLYYITSTMAICSATNTESMRGVKGYLLAMCQNAIGIIVWLAVQYGTLFANGVAAFPTQALSGILLIAMVPTLMIAACFSRALYKRTGNIWTPAFFNGILFTMMTIANTCVYNQF